MAGVRDWYGTLVSAKVPCFLKSMRPLFRYYIMDLAIIMLLMIMLKLDLQLPI